MTLRLRLFLTLALGLLIGLAPAVSLAEDEAASNDDFWTVRGFVAGIGTSGESARGEMIRLTGDREQTHFRFDGGDGFGFAFERHVSQRLGVELAVLLADLKGQLMFDIAPPVPGGGYGEALRGMNEGDVGFTSLTLGLNVHLMPNSRADLFIGPFLGLELFDSVTISDLGESFRCDLDDEVAFGVSVGLDVPFKRGGRWALAARVSYLEVDARVAVALLEHPQVAASLPGASISLEPLIATIGLAY